MPDESIRETNKAVARQVIEAWNQRGETHLPNELVSSQMVRHHQGMGFAALGDGGTPADAALPRSAFRDQHFTEELVLADEHHAFIAWELTATHHGEIHGMAATGRQVTVFGSDVIRLADGKIIQHWDYYPKARVHALAQLGLLSRDVQRQMIDQGQFGRNRRTGKARV
jgi:predicted ester cyclase